MLRRFVPLLVLLGLSVCALLARLWDVQIEQHRIWATEAANLVRSAAVEPYRRGDILDRHGRVLVRDEETYVLEFVWRDFRRGHPIGQLAMMRSLVLMRPVGLDDVRRTLGDAALAYASLTPKDLEDFARGKALDAGVDYVPAIAAEDANERLRRAREERRRSRAGDLRYYLTRLLRLSNRDARAVGERIEDGGADDLSFIELSAWVLDQTPQEVRDRLRSHVLQADQHLARLALLVDWEEPNAPTVDRALSVLSPGDRLISLMEARRSEVEDESANELFRIAARFPPTRLDVQNLRAFDLEWIRTALDWDDQRLDEWIERTGGAFEREVDAWLAPHTIARAKIDSTQPADCFLSAFAHAFRREPDAWTRKNAAPQNWRQVDELCVLTGLADRLDRGDAVPEDIDAAVLPIQDEELRTAALEGEALLRAHFGSEVDTARLLALASATGSDWSEGDEDLVAGLLIRGHRALQARARAALRQVSASQEGAPVAFDPAHVEKALETRRYVIRDRGARPKVVGREPRIELVLLVTRYPEAFAGFSVTSKMRRTPTVFEGEHRTPLAANVIGRVRSPFLVQVLRQRPGQEELGKFQRKLELPEEDRAQILRLVDRAYQRDEKVGGSGLEAWFDDELAGTSGYREVHGLQDRVEGNRAPIEFAAVDGEDVVTTLDIDLQARAVEVLERPEPPATHDPKLDVDWFERPVGAIVLATVDGEILVAASVPTVDGLEPGPFTDGERARAIDRTLLRPVGQAPGSVVKPLLAAYALEHLGLDPGEGLEYCDADRPRQGARPKSRSNRAGFGAIDCNARWGHSRQFDDQKLMLATAIKASCNVYFAALGERFFDEASMRDAYRTFGFGSPTGVLFDDDGSRQGLRDSYWLDPRSELRTDAGEGRVTAVVRQRVANGLTHVDANVVQVARAYAGLATGRLPEMRLVKRVGETEVPRRLRSLGIGEEHLRFVRESVEGVIHDSRGGSAHGKGLSEEDLGFRFAAKTGSADYHVGRLRPAIDGDDEDDGKGMRKHTWVAGWFPAENPRYVLTVYVHDTTTTASHSAVYVASQLLRSDEVRALLGLASGGSPR